MKEQAEQRLTAVFFDVDDTMYDLLEPTRLALREVLELPETFDYEQAFHQIRHYSDVLSDEAKLSDRNPGEEELSAMRTRRYILAMRRFGLELSQGQAEELQARYEARQKEIAPFTGAVELMKQLQDGGMQVGLITNGEQKHQFRKIQTLGLDKVVPADRIFISGSVGIAKPSPGIFHYVNQQTGTSPEECVYIGDSWRNDVVGAIAAGWNMIWYNYRAVAQESDRMPLRTVASFEELREVLGELSLI
ncbi:HAD family hydrolase [Paenibacillus sp. JX-17]|uniref:HAD family hydrolase n=1 Tax=Paenibacillus lacisoli TaxID=3064525 RepID=A0ABT9CH78_9BACL|nr:HAD family hydrolase [Paenibacillus sp. JX-17]MDO7908617.1 HAD family hydrolase [Paenibacillus sp. JX-17]